MTTVDLGDTVPLGVEVVDGAGVPTTPATITLAIYRPDGVVDTPSPTAEAVGRYVWDYVPPVAGPYRVRWASTAPATAHVVSFDVAAPSLGRWPPLLADVRRELKRTDADRGDDDLLQTALDAAVAWVEGQRAGDLNFTGAPSVTLPALPAPGPDVCLGTVRLAIRWHHLRASPNGLVDMGELGSARIPSYDAFTEQLLGVGRYRAPMVG